MKMILKHTMRKYQKMMDEASTLAENGSEYQKGVREGMQLIYEDLDDLFKNYQLVKRPPKKDDVDMVDTATVSETQSTADARPNSAALVIK